MEQWAQNVPTRQNIDDGVRRVSEMSDLQEGKMEDQRDSCRRRLFRSKSYFWMEQFYSPFAPSTRQPTAIHTMHVKTTCMIDNNTFVGSITQSISHLGNMEMCLCWWWSNLVHLPTGGKLGSLSLSISGQVVMDKSRFDFRGIPEGQENDP